MNYQVKIKKFKAGDYAKKINASKSTIESEKYFKKIAFEILSSEGFKKIKEGPSTSEIKGVPYDFIAEKNGKLSLIELKGSKETFNYSKEVQFSRLSQLLEVLKVTYKVKPDIYLLQINLKYSIYQLLDSGFYKIIFDNLDPKAGTATKNIPLIAEETIKRSRK